MAKPPATRLAEIVASESRTHEEIVRAWTALAVAMREEEATLSVRQFRRWLTGDLRRMPHAASQRVSAQFWDTPFAELLQPPPTVHDNESPPPGVAQDLRTIVMASAEDAFDHASSVANFVDQDSIEALADRVAQHARSYATTPPLEMFHKLRRLRDQAKSLLERTNAPDQQELLYLILSQASALLAGVSFDLGVGEAASDHAHSAHTYGRLIGNASAQGLARAVQTTLAFWGGEPARGLRLAQDGLKSCSSGSVAVRLYAVTARCHALMNDAESTRQALLDAEQARGGDDPTFDAIGGEFVFTAARTAFCAGAAWLALEHGEAAARESRRALELFAATPADQRWYGGLYGAQADLVAAEVYTEDLGDAADHMEALLTAPPEMRTSRLVRRALGVQNAVSGRRYRGSADALRLVGQAELFIADANSMRALPPGGA